MIASSGSAVVTVSSTDWSAQLLTAVPPAGATFRRVTVVNETIYPCAFTISKDATPGSGEMIRLPAGITSGSQVIPSSITLEFAEGPMTLPRGIRAIKISSNVDLSAFAS